MRCHREESGIDDTAIAFGHLVDGGFHIVVRLGLSGQYYIGINRQRQGICQTRAGGSSH
jgi:hypothetical protein